MLFYHAEIGGQNQHSHSRTFKPPCSNIRALYQSSNKIGMHRDFNECFHQHSAQSPNDATKQPCSGRRTNCGSICTPQTHPLNVDVTRRHKQRKSFPNQSCPRFRGHDVNNFPAYTSKTQSHSQHQQNWLQSQGCTEKSSTSSGHGRFLCKKQRRSNGNLGSSFSKHWRQHANSLSRSIEIPGYSHQLFLRSASLHSQSQRSCKDKTRFQRCTKRFPKSYYFENSQPYDHQPQGECKPLKVLAARRVPKRFEEPAENTVKDLISKGVLA